MKVSELFESKVITEGTWAQPDTPERTKKFIDLMSKPLSGKDAAKKLYHLFGDDILFDELHDLEKSEDVRLVVMKAMKRILKAEWFRGEDQKEALKDFVKKSERTISESAAWDTPETVKKLKDLRAKFAALINTDKPAAEKIRKQIQDINKESRDTADARGYKSGAPPKGWKLD
jgi:hypothetical protein